MSGYRIHADITDYSIDKFNQVTQPPDYYAVRMLDAETSDYHIFSVVSLTLNYCAQGGRQCNKHIQTIDLLQSRQLTREILQAVLGHMVVIDESGDTELTIQVNKIRPGLLPNSLYVYTRGRLNTDQGIPITLFSYMNTTSAPAKLVLESFLGKAVTESKTFYRWHIDLDYYGLEKLRNALELIQTMESPL